MSNRKKAVVLGDHHTTAETERLAAAAAEHGYVVSALHGFEPGKLVAAQNLADQEAVVTAASAAVSTGAAVWLPFPQDLGCEDNLRRLHLALERCGGELLLGMHLHPLPAGGAMSALDNALRTEVRMVSELATTITSTAAADSLEAEVLRELQAAAAAAAPAVQPTTAAGTPTLPDPAAPWAVKVGALRAWARARANAGATQAAIAAELNALGHTSRRGARWSQGLISHLLSSGYDTGSAAPGAA